MADYISAPIPVDPDELKAQAFDYLRNRFPGWEPADGNLDAWIIEAYAELVAQVGEVASNVTEAIFRYYGAKVAGVPPREASQATGLTTWTAIDDAGYVIPEGTTVAFDAGGELVAFQTVDTVTIEPGQTTVSGVVVTAAEAGSSGSGLTGEGQLIDPLDFVASVTLEGPTTGGVDAEPDEDYMNRLADELRLLAPRPILAEDFATLARRVPGVARVLAIDNYIPAGPGGNPPAQTYAERAVTVVCVDEAGEPISSAARQAVDDLLQAEREVNFVVNVIDPTYTTIDVAFTATAWPGWDPADVEAAAISAVRNYLSPADWGQPTFGEARGWVNEPRVRLLEVAQVLNSVEGLRYVESLTLNGLAADVEMEGVAPLPRPGTISGTVS